MTMLRMLSLALSVALCSGCVGFATYGDVEHRRPFPVLSLDRARYAAYSNEYLPPNKNQLLAAWGSPDRIDTEKGRERWIYKEQIPWNGVLLYALILPVPLMLPVGRSYMVIEFSNDTIVGSETVGYALKYEAACGVLPSHSQVIGFGCKTQTPEIRQPSGFFGGTTMTPNSLVERDARKSDARPSP